MVHDELFGCIKPSHTRVSRVNLEELKIHKCPHLLRYRLISSTRDTSNKKQKRHGRFSFHVSAGRLDSNETRTDTEYYIARQWSYLAEPWSVGHNADVAICE